MKKIQPSLKQLISLVLLILLFGNVSLLLEAQENKKKPNLTMKAQEAREYSLQYLDSMERILKERYYDPKLRGIDLKTRIEAAKARIKTLEYNWQMYRVLVQVLMDFNDSHT